MVQLVSRPSVLSISFIKHVKDTQQFGSNFNTPWSDLRCIMSRRSEYHRMLVIASYEKLCLSCSMGQILDWIPRTGAINEIETSFRIINHLTHSSRKPLGRNEQGPLLCLCADCNCDRLSVKAFLGTEPCDCKQVTKPSDWKYTATDHKHHEAVL